MRIIISNHSEDNIVESSLVNLTKDSFIAIKEPLWSAMGKNCYARIKYIPENAGEWKCLLRMSDVKPNQLKRDMISFTVRLYRNDLYPSCLSDETYNKIVDIIMTDFNVTRK